MSTPDPAPVDLSELKPGPIRHESLPPELLEHVQAIFDVIGPYFDMTLEQFEIGFMRDAHPENEVAVWCSITAAWIKQSNWRSSTWKRRRRRTGTCIGAWRSSELDMATFVNRR